MLQSRHALVTETQTLKATLLCQTLMRLLQHMLWQHISPSAHVNQQSLYYFQRKQGNLTEEKTTHVNKYQKLMKNQQHITNFCHTIY